MDDVHSYLLPERESLGWSDLLDRSRVVLLAGARAGKTSEIQLQVAALKRTGNSAFFVQLNELYGSTLESACMRDGEAFRVWLNGTDLAWFFLDARDELAVTGKQFYRALTTLKEGLGVAASRAKLLITSRPSDWKSLSDLGDFKQLFPIPALRVAVAETAIAAQALDAVENLHEVKQTEATQGDDFLVVQMLPLDEGRILKLAVHCDVEESVKFQAALRRQGAVELAGTPGDLKGIVTLWKGRKEFRNFEEIVQSTIQTNLVELRNLPEAKAQFSLDQYKGGARRLAALIALARGTAFRVDHDETAGRPTSGICADEAFADWQPNHLDAVLRTPLFEPHGFGHLHFRNRTVKEYLAAQWAIEIERRFGLTRGDLFSLFFSDIYGESLLVPSMAPIAAWAAIYDERVLSEILVRCPETLLEYGDPEQFTLERKRSLLKRLVSSALKKGTRFYARDSRMLRVLANANLSNQIGQLWSETSKKAASQNPRHQEDALVLLLKLVELGSLKQFSKLALKYGLSKKRSWFAVISALRAVVSLGVAADINKYVRHLLSNAEALERRVVLGSVQELYPQYLTAAQALRLIDLRADGGNSIDIEPEHTVSQLIEANLTSSQRNQLVNEFASRWFASWRAAPKIRVDPRKSEKKWIVYGLLKLATQLLDINKSTVKFSKTQTLAIAGAIQYSDDYLQRKESKSVREAMLTYMSREKLFWALFNGFRHWHPYSRLPSDCATKVNLLVYWMRLRSPDLNWILSTSGKDEREAIVWAALRIWQIEGKPPGLMARVEARAGSDPKLLALIEFATDVTESPDAQHFREQSQRLAEEQEKQKRVIAESWARFREEIVANPGLLTDESAGQAAARANALGNLYAWLTRPQLLTRNRNVYAVANLQDLASEYGQVAVDSAILGFKSFWRSKTSKLPSALRGNERNQTSYVSILSLTGLAVETQEGGRWIQTLFAREVRLAVRHAFCELNGFPSWMPSMAAAHPRIVNSMIEKEVRSELMQRDQEVYPSILSRIPQQDAREWPGLAERVIKALWAKSAINDRAFGLAIDVLLKFGYSEKEACERLYIAKTSSNTETDSHKIAYIAAWFALDADRATDSLFKLISGKARKHKDRIVLGVFASLSGEMRGIPMRLSTNDNVKTLTRLVALANKHISTKDDMQHDGVYSPGLRDNAERGRNYVVQLLSEIPGPAAYDALIRLAAQPDLQHIADGMRRAALNRALEDSERPWKPSAVLEFERTAARKPDNIQELADLLLKRLTEIKEALEDGDFGQTEILKLAKRKEKYFQYWLAEQLELRSRGFYSVTREPEVKFGKKPDVVVQCAGIAARVPIEVKVADAWTGIQLRSAFKLQLVGKYQRDRNATHGILLLISLKQSKAWHIGRKRIHGIKAFSEALNLWGAKQKKRTAHDLTTVVVVLRLWT